jgi:prepilin-type N-terminal cleavage/methylation domain-containing protein
MNTHLKNKGMRKKQDDSKMGFTLIEIIVSVALFTIVMTISVGALFMIITANREAKAIKLVVNNLNIAMEGMTRDLRVGYNYCDINTSQPTVLRSPACNTSGSGTDQIYYTTDIGEALSYYTVSNGSIIKRKGSGQAFQVTGDDVVIDNLRFYINGSESGDSVQPYVTITARGRIQVAEAEQEFQLQSTVTQRRLAP